MFIDLKVPFVDIYNPSYGSYLLDNTIIIVSLAIVMAIVLFIAIDLFADKDRKDDPKRKETYIYYGGLIAVTALFLGIVSGFTTDVMKKNEQLQVQCDQIAASYMVDIQDCRALEIPVENPGNTYKVYGTSTAVTWTKLGYISQPVTLVWAGDGFKLYQENSAGAVIGQPYIPYYDVVKTPIRDI